MKIRANLDGKKTSQFPPPSMGGPRESSYRGLSAVKGLDHPPSARFAREGLRRQMPKGHL